MDYKLFDNRYTNRLLWYKDTEVQFQNREAQVPEWLAYRLSRKDGATDFVYENKLVPFNPDSWKKERRMIWGGNVSLANGYGNVAYNTFKALMQLGVNVGTWGGLSGNPLSGSEFVDDIVKEAVEKDPYPDCLEIQHQQPPAFKHNIIEKRWAYSMYETTHTPRSWIKILNQMDHILVPSTWLIDSWKEQGVTRPIDVYQHGIDPEIYYYMERPEREMFTFIHYCQLSERKGTGLLAKAFADEFGKTKDVKLILKNIFPIFPISPSVRDRANIECIAQTMTQDEMKDFLFNADCAVYPSSGEGFLLPGLECMATGMPLITTGWSGMVDYADKEDTLLLDYKMVHSTEFDMIYKEFYEQGESAGDWAQPSYEDLRAKMRFVYENRKKAKAMGKHAAERVARSWKWIDKASDLISIINNNI